MQKIKGKEYKRVDIQRIKKYIVEAGFGINSSELTKDDYIPESLIYLLGMKANNKVAKEFQKLLAIEKKLGERIIMLVENIFSLFFFIFLKK